MATRRVNVLEGNMVRHCASVYAAEITLHKWDIEKMYVSKSIQLWTRSKTPTVASQIRLMTWIWVWLGIIAQVISEYTGCYCFFTVREYCLMLLCTKAESFKTKAVSYNANSSHEQLTVALVWHSGIYISRRFSDYLIYYSLAFKLHFITLQECAALTIPLMFVRVYFTLAVCYLYVLEDKFGGKCLAGFRWS